MWCNQISTRCIIYLYRKWPIMGPNPEVEIPDQCESAERQRMVSFAGYNKAKKRFYKTWKSHNYSLAGVLLPLPSNQSAGGCGHTGVADPRAFCCLSTRIFLYESWKRFWGFLKFEGRVENAVKRKKYYKFIGVKQNDLNQKVHVFIFQKNLWC